MTDFEKINRPVVYDKEGKYGQMLTNRRYEIKYIFNTPMIGCTFVDCFSILNDSKTDIIAGFRVTKLHDTRRKD